MEGKRRLLDDALKSAIRGAYEQLVEVRGLTPRLGQREMIAEVANALGDPEVPTPVAVVEAGTGTGKTIAYTLAGIPAAAARGKHLVIATATVALQEQLLHKDLPDILEHSGLDFVVQIAKGRGRYVCLQKLDHGLAGVETPALIPIYPDELADDAVDEYALMQSMLDTLATGKWDGDLDAWPNALSAWQRRRVTSDAFQCSGRRCPHVSQCSFFRARDGLADADVIVTNHDLVLADLKLGGGAILPPPEECLYVFDEGHRLPEKCLGHFTLGVRAAGTEQALTDLGRALPQLPDVIRDALGKSDLVTRLQADCADLGQLTMDLEAASRAWLADRDQDTEHCRFVSGVVPVVLADMVEQLETAWRQHLDHARRLEMTAERCAEEASPDDRDVVDVWLANAQAMVGRAESQFALWESYARGGEQPDGPPDWARWLRTNGSDQRIEWYASPILASELLDKHLWSRAAGAVVSSATLSALGRFDRFRERSGVPADARFRRVSSPFDPQRVVFAVPPMTSDPTNHDAHTREVCAQLPDLVEGVRGVLVLFSSRRQMNAVADAMDGSLAHRLLVQDSLGKAELLARHRDTIDSGGASVIFGLASFAEGIDLPGVYCEHVIIAKLPFAVPDDPLEAAHAERVEAQGGNAFMDISVPDAALKLTQACGRLQRSEQDGGRITLLDRRIINRRYGKEILSSLPRYQFELS